jgi:putative Ca2+/H+ antiporter (TMEM165/GDT1 family)
LSLEAFAVSTGVVALGEMGDKTQLLALLLVARWRQPWTIAAGILVATLANHAGAAALGALVTRWLSPELMRWILGLSFIAVALWMLKPDDATVRLRKAWKHTLLGPKDIVVITHLPLGGGGGGNSLKQIGGTLALLALVIARPQRTPAVSPRAPRRAPSVRALDTIRMAMV